MWEITDTAGTQQFTAMRQFMPHPDGALFLYSITDLASFKEIPEIVENFRIFHDKTDVPCILVGYWNGRKKVENIEAESFHIFDLHPLMSKIFLTMQERNLIWKTNVKCPLSKEEVTFHHLMTMVEMASKYRLEFIEIRFASWRFYLHYSSKTRYNVDVAFCMLLHKLLEYYPLGEKDNNKKKTHCVIQ